MKAKKWLRLFFILMIVFYVGVGGIVIYLDPFFHYHAPLSSWSYELSDQRSQNDGITRHFEYDAIITGTSMAENFLTSEFDSLFGTDSVKLPYPGATFKEINDNLEVAFETHDEIRIVLRPLDYSHITEDKDAMRMDMGEYPEYLYDDNPFNDLEYLYNWDVVAYYILPMLEAKLKGEEGSITSFDDYSSSAEDECSKEAALTGISGFGVADEQEQLTEEEVIQIEENMEQNVIALARQHPETTFICFFPPYSAVWWGCLKEDGTLIKQIEAEEIAARMMLEETDNIRVYSFNLHDELIFDLDNYKDAGHYGAHVNSWILSWIEEGEGELTLENLDEYIAEETQLYLEYDYTQLLTEQQEEGTGDSQAADVLEGIHNEAVE